MARTLVKNLKQVTSAIRAMGRPFKGGRGDDVDGKSTAYAGYDLEQVGPYPYFVHGLTEMKLKGQPRRGLVKFQNASHKGNYWDPPGSEAEFLKKALASGGQSPWAQTVISRGIQEILKQVAGTGKGQNLYAVLLAVAKGVASRSNVLAPMEFGGLRRAAFYSTEGSRPRKDVTP